MKLITLGSGSSGNCHVLKDSNGKMLLLDCGLPIKEIKQGINFCVSDVVGVLVTHSHADHSKSKGKLQSMGIPILDTEGIIRYGDYRVFGFSLKNHYGDFVHTNADGSRCPIYGFEVFHPEMGTLTYITDCQFCIYRLVTTHLLMGVNYDAERVVEGNPKNKHILSGHMSLDTAKRIVTMTSPQTLVMCHLSEGNADAEKFVTEMKKVCGCPVYVARHGMEIDLRKDGVPF